MQEQVVRTLGQPQDRSSLVERFDPTPIITPIIEQMLGIRTVVSQDTTKRVFTYKRNNQPIFTEEYTRVIEGILRGAVNNVVSFSKFDKEEIRLRVINMFKTHGDSLATMGNDHFISQQTWRRILEVHESGKYVDENKVVHSGWERFNITWDYNSPVTYDMVEDIKDFDEQVGQEVTFSIIAQTIRTNIAACLNRSLAMPDNYYGMMTNLVGETTVEQNNNSLTQSDPQSQGSTW